MIHGPPGEGLHTIARGGLEKPRAVVARAMVSGESCGVIYFIQAKVTNFVKIGTCYNARIMTRANEIQQTCPVPIRILATMRGDAKAERWLHHRFRHLRRYGEWFRPERELLEYIAENATPWTGGKPDGVVRPSKVWKETPQIGFRVTAAYRVWLCSFSKSMGLLPAQLVVSSLSWFFRGSIDTAPTAGLSGLPIKAGKPKDPEKRVTIAFGCSLDWKRWLARQCERKGLSAQAAIIKAMEWQALEAGFEPPPSIKGYLDDAVIPEPRRWSL